MGVLDRFRLDGKRLFITGGSRGLGREMALAIAEAGADVVLTGRETKSLDTTAEEIRQLGRRADTVQADMSNMSACESACQQAIQRFGPIHILINNVGGRRENIPTQDMPLAKWRELMDLNLTMYQAAGWRHDRTGSGWQDHQRGFDQCLCCGAEDRGPTL